MRYIAIADDVARVKALKAEGMRPTDIAKRLGIGRASVYVALKDGRGSTLAVDS